MKTPKIPPGYRKLRKGTILRKGDKFPAAGKWFRTMQVGDKFGNCTASSYIRPVSKPKTPWYRQTH